MELEIKTQAWALAAALLCGAGVGLVYDLIRPFRYRAGKAGALILDALFCFLTFAAVFLYGQQSFRGRLDIWEMLGFLLGFWLYMASLSPLILKLVNGVLGLILGFFAASKALIKKLHDFLKFYFQKEQ